MILKYVTIQLFFCIEHMSFVDITYGIGSFFPFTSY